MTESFVEIIRQVGEPIALALGLEILEIQSSGRSSNPLVRVTIDKEGGVGIEDCERFHQSLRRSWEVNHPNGPTCRFEISSPGLDRPLKDYKDFRRVLGKRLRITLRDGFKENGLIIGRLVDLSDKELFLEEKVKGRSETRVIEWGDIQKARLDVDF